jgi:hypothetical protein
MTAKSVRLAVLLPALLVFLVPLAVLTSISHAPS